MADRLYLSLWYPNFRLESLPAALTGVLRQFSILGGKRVSAASAYAIDFTQPPTYQRIYVNTGPAAPDTHAPPEISAPTEESDGLLEAAVTEATEQLHDDMAYEFEMRWHLWSLEPPALPSRHLHPPSSLDDDSTAPDDAGDDSSFDVSPHNPSTAWRLRSHSVRILGFGPHFDVAGYEQNGHLLVDFGLDTPWVMDTPPQSTISTATTSAAPETSSKNTSHIQIAPRENSPAPLDEQAQIYIQQNIEKLLAFTLLVEKNCGISSRLLWTESGEPLAEKLIARLQRVN